MYKKIIRPLLFKINPEVVHKLAVFYIRIISMIPGLAMIIRSILRTRDSGLQKKLMNLTFKNPVGLAAGFDKDAEIVDELANFGFGFIEIGTLTPKPQPGNPKPRLFRLPVDKALVNRMGFNNEGVQKAGIRLRKRKCDLIIGGNIGKNKNTPNERAVDDYLYCLQHLYDEVDYFVVNVSSPNTPGLRELQEKEPLKDLLKILKNEISRKRDNKPLLLKISPDLSKTQLDDIIDIINELDLEGIVATNTTVSRENLQTPEAILGKIGEGGLSGAPLNERSNEIIRYLKAHLKKETVIIGVGGIMSVDDAMEKLNSGADLIQLYTGFIYEGPGIISQINKALISKNAIGQNPDMP